MINPSKRTQAKRPARKAVDPSFRNRIRELRLARKMTLEELAALVDTSFQQISRLERSSRKLTQDWMERLAKAFGVRPSEVMEDCGVAVPSRAHTDDKSVNSDEEFAWLRLYREFTPLERRLAIKLLSRGFDDPKGS